MEASTELEPRKGLFFLQAAPYYLHMSNIINPKMI
jgi:hypothetical protein